jgi:hypothetical protein
MILYSATSVISALKKRTELSCEGIDNVKCPSPETHQDCKGQPNDCILCINQKCKQFISIHRDFKKLRILFFRFMVSRDNHDGFIPKDDSALMQLIRLQLLDETSLRPIK